jgi:3-(3-hydroxy-phenyl)propionate hydroxylase
MSGCILDDRLTESSQHAIGVADVDGALESAVGSARGAFVLVKSDHYVAAVFTAGQASETIAELTEPLNIPRPTDQRRQ